MNNKTIMMAALAATALTSFTAQADGRWPNWYVGLHGAMAFVSDTDVESNPGGVSGFSNDAGMGYGVALGYRPATTDPILNKFRFELEWHRQTSDVDKVDSNRGAFNGDGETVASAGLFNVYYDFVMNGKDGQPFALAPYVGAGLGWANVKIDGTSVFLGNVNETDNVFAWQFMTGVSYAPQFLPFTEWTLGYRYFDTANPSYSYLGASTFDIDYASHNLEAGIRFLF